MDNSSQFYQSPFSWRYGSSEMRKIWGEENKYLTWRKLWCSLACVEKEFGLVSQAQLDDLLLYAENIDIEETRAEERKVRHDVMAEVRVYQSQALVGGEILHLGATSSDIKDNAIVLLTRDSLHLLVEKIDLLLSALKHWIQKYKDTPIIAFTHLQPAEPTTLGYRLAFYAQDLLIDREAILQQCHSLKGKGFRGAVGTGASFAEIIGIENVNAFDEQLSKKLSLEFFPVVTQTYPRKQDFQLLSVLSGLGASLHKFAFDVRLMQSPVIFEWSEPFGKHQIGSSAMPFKKNPIQAEKIDSLARLLAQYPSVAWGNAANALLERTLDDSANRRTILPEAFLICDELLITAENIVKKMNFFETHMQENFHCYAPFSAIERILMNVCRAGANRQEMHEHLRRLSMQAWKSVQEGLENPLLNLIQKDKMILSYLSPEALNTCISVDTYTGMASEKAGIIARTIDKIVN